MENLRAIKGKSQILLFRLLEEANQKTAAKLAFQTEHEVSKSRDSDTTETKDGPISVAKGLEEEIKFNCIMATEDPVAIMLETALEQDKILEVWEVDVTKETEEGKYPGIYRQGLLTEMSRKANAEDLMELDCTYKTNGIGKRGDVTLTAEQKEVVQYAFADTEKKEI